jgi:hypothetical protein
VAGRPARLPPPAAALGDVRLGIANESFNFDGRVFMDSKIIQSLHFESLKNESLENFQGFAWNRFSKDSLADNESLETVRPFFSIPAALTAPPHPGSPAPRPGRQSRRAARHRISRLRDVGALPVAKTYEQVDVAGRMKSFSPPLIFLRWRLQRWTTRKVVATTRVAQSPAPYGPTLARRQRFGRFR